MNVRKFFLASVMVALTSTLTAAEPEEILLWPKGAPGSEGQTAPEKITETGGVRRVSSIHHPSITAHLPSKDTATGAAVIVLPGGGHQYLSIDNEGHVAAQWLADRGVAAFVLKYRLAREPGSTYKVEVHALQDAQRALRLVRSRAKEWNIDPQRVGVLGFSAGGEIATYATVRFDAGNPQADDPIDRESSRPDFQGLIYAGIGKLEGDLPKDTPPAFICVADDDKGKVGIDVDLFQKLRTAGVPAELHVYNQGGHGFGMRDRPLPITNWPKVFYDWLGDRGLLKKTTASSP
jgi:acetyl esterase/lipase